jgi:hypothetical protein
MENRVYNISEALELLKSSLERCGLESVNISINGHDLTPVKSGDLVRDLIVGGFGERVSEAGQTFRYSQRQGHYSWVTVEQGGDRINLFYNL